MVRHLLKSSNNILHLCNIGERREEEKREEEKERKKRNIEEYRGSSLIVGSIQS